MASSATSARHSHWSLVMFNGVLLLLSGIALALFPLAGALAMAAAFGVYLVAVGAVGLVVSGRALLGGHGSVLALVGPPLALLIGFVFWMRPGIAAETMANIFGAFTLVVGLFQIATALGLIGRKHWGLLLANGVLTAAAGVCISLFPLIALEVFAIFFGLQLAFHGGHFLHVGARMRRMMP